MPTFVVERDMAKKALGKNYFQNEECPINLSRVNRKHNVSHEHDLTETEHFHDFVELVFILNGQGTQVLEEHEYFVSAGDVFVLQGYQRHYFKDAHQLEIVNLMYDLQSFPHLLSEKTRQLDGYKALFILEPQYRTHYHFKNMLRLNRQELGSIEVMLNTMFAEQEQKNEAYDIILANRLEELIILLSRHYSNVKTTKAKALIRIGKVIEYIENHFHESIYIDDLADMAFMSKRNFMRIFKGAVGLSPINYVKLVRLQNARKMLRETEKPIADISIFCGFTDSNYFIKCFKEAYEITPNKFRARFKLESKNTEVFQNA